ncbi:MAG: hypothetical protein FJX23_06780 [Alphaproteobacteria bacterium]|nr:hypothetical protein [Alphaproteobacteria bacterium]
MAILRGMMVMVGAALLSTSALAADYTVRDVPVSATAEDATTARMNAMAQADTAAFAKLLQGMLPPDQAAAKAASVPASTISSLVNGYDVKNEKLSARSYSASIDVSFNPRKVDALLSGAAPVAAAPAVSGYAVAQPPVTRPGGGTVYSPSRGGVVSSTTSYTLNRPGQPSIAAAPAAVAANPVVLVLPVGRSGQLWDESNLWRSVWNRTPRSDTNLVRLPIGDQSDKLVLPDASQAGSFAQVSTLAERYQAGTVVVAEAEDIIASTGVKALQVTLRTLRSGDNYTDQPWVFEAEGGETPEQVMARAAAEIAARLTTEAQGQQAVLSASPSSAPTAANPAAAAGPVAGRITVLSRLNNVSDWVSLRNKLSALPAVARVELSALSQQQADVIVHYRGGLPQLEAALQGAGIRVDKAANYWIISL